MNVPTALGNIGNRSIGTAAEAGAFLEDWARNVRPVPGHPPPPGQNAIRELLARTGNPHRQLETIHIAGSKGKGSTALLVEAILQAGGKRTGTFTSPHLERWTERYRVDGREDQGDGFARAMERLRPHALALLAENPDNAPGFFDLATAAGLNLFRDAGVEIAIVEAGLGGRLDATNIVEPAVICITSIELEHTERLGDSLEAIAREKAGIIKPGIPVVIGNLPAEAACAVLNRATAMAAPVVALHRELAVRVDARRMDGFELSLSLGTLQANHIRLPLLGEHSVGNTALAVACCSLLNAFDGPGLVRAIRTGCASARLPGRIEVLKQAPWVIADAAHTASSAQALAETLERIPAKRNQLVLSVSKRENLALICEALLPRFQTVTVTSAEPMRSLPAQDLAAFITNRYPDTKLSVVADPVEALQGAFRTLAPDALLCATGSVYMAGIARATLAADAGS